MDIENPRPPDNNGEWNAYMACLLVAVVVIVFANLFGLRAEKSSEAGEPGLRQFVVIGDFVADQAIMPESEPERLQIASKAIAYYRYALPLLEARRRIGVLKEWTGSPDGISDLEKTGSRAEAAMWRAVYGNGKMSPERAGELAARIKAHGFGSHGTLSAFAGLQKSRRLLQV